MLKYASRMTESGVSMTALSRIVVSTAAILYASIVSPDRVLADHGLSGFDVEFTDCVESIGVTLLPTEQVEELIPDGFIVVGAGQPVTPIVVRTARCRISVDGRRARTGSVVQIGAVIVPPDFTGDINNYTLLYHTSDLKLSLELKKLGMPAQYVPTIDYELIRRIGDNPDQLQVTVPRPGRPLLSVAGEVISSDVPAGSFTANWWSETHRGTVRMQTFVPEIFIGGADLTLTTVEGNRLSELIGGETIAFPILQQFNTFPDALLDVSISAP